MNLNRFPAVTVFNRTSKAKFFKTYRSYSTNSLENLPISVVTINNLHVKTNVINERNLLVNKAGIYAFVNNINGKQYIGSAKDLYLRLNEHLRKRKSNKALQSAILKHGIENFSFCVYEYFTYVDKLSSAKLLTDLETIYIKKFNFTNLYNFIKTATSLEGYKHTDAAKLKMVKRFEDKTNHPFFFFFSFRGKKI